MYTRWIHSTMSAHQVGGVLLTALLAVFVLPLAWRIPPANATGDLLHAQAFAIAGFFWLMWFAAFGAVHRAVAWAVFLALSWWPTEMALRYTYATGVNAGFIGLVSGTNAAELLELARTFGLDMMLWSLPTLLLGGLTWWSTKLLGWRINTTWRLRLLTAGLTIMAATWYALAEQDHLWRSSAPTDELAGSPPGYIAEALAVVYPINGWLALYAAHQNSRVIHSARERMDRTPFAPEPTGEAGAELMVLVVGESSSAARWGLAGAPRNTTPRLKRREGLVYLHDVVAPAMATRVVVPSLVSWAPLYSATAAVNPRPEAGFLAAFNELGWSTAWLTNQPAQGVFDNPIVFYARDAQRQRFINPGSYSEATPYDEALVPELLATIKEAKPGQHVAAVVHTMGSHFNYGYRYPESFDVFRPSLSSRDKNVHVDLASRQEVLNAYDNSILYTDYVLDRLIDGVAQQRRPAALIYISDHGDDVPDGSCMTLVGLRTTAGAARVPALIWISPELQALRPGLMERLRAVAHRPMQAQWVASTVMDLAGLRIPRHPEPDITRSVHRGPRMVHLMGRSVDFDVAERTAPCSLTAASTTAPAKKK
jgi:glucan phosphoethanolaminetransferase (alkaline phosphatase superfamily)